MNNFLRGGRGMAVGQSRVRLRMQNRDRLLCVPRLLHCARKDVSYITIIFCVLFSVPDLLEGRALAQSPQHRDKRLAFTQALAQGSRDVSRIDFGDKLGTEGLKRIEPLKVGDNIPDALWKVNLHIVNHKKEEVSDLRRLFDNKELLILDFWATWCRSCVEAFPKIDQLNKAFGDKVTVIPITMEDPAKVRKWFAIHDRGLRTAYALDSARSLYSYFPHNILPHVVILDRTSVRAIIAGSDLTTTNITTILNNNSKGLAMKKDSVLFDNSKPLLISDVNGFENRFLARAIFTDPLEGVSSRYLIRKDEERNRVSYKIINYTFRSVWTAVYRDFSSLRANQFVVSPDIAGILDSSFCYELIYPLERAEYAPQKIKQDLASFFGVTADWEVRSEPTLVLQEIQKGNNRLDTGKEVAFTAEFQLDELQDSSTTGLIYALNNSRKSPLFAMESPTVKKKLQEQSLSGFKGFKNLRELNNWLKTEGLEFVQQINPVNYIVYKKTEL